MLCYVAYTADKSSTIYPLQQLKGNTPNFFFFCFLQTLKRFPTHWSRNQVKAADLLGNKIVQIVLTEL